MKTIKQLKNSLSWGNRGKTSSAPQFGDRVYITGVDSGFFIVEAVLRTDVIIVFERKPATMYMFIKTSEDTWTITQEWELRKGTRRSIIVRELVKKYSKKVPSLGDKCLIVFEGEIESAYVTKIDNRLAQFNIRFPYGELLNIPYSNFKPF